MNWRLSAKVFVPAAIAMVLLALTPEIPAQSGEGAAPPPQTEANPGDLSGKELEIAIQKHEELLRTYENHEYTPTILFQLSELFVRKANLEFDQAMTAFEVQSNDFQAGKTTTEPKLPQINYNLVILLLERILAEYPHYNLNDKVLYRLALSFQEQGDEDKAGAYFDRLISKYPLSSLRAEAYFRMGEYFFAKEQDLKAIPYYSHLVSADMWSNPFFDMALYKLGWSHYRLNNYAEAISAFMYLLKDIKTIERVQTQELDRSAADLRKEAIAYTAISFSELGDPAQTTEFLNAFSSEDDKYEILARLAAVYIQQNRLDEAMGTSRQLLEEVPNHPNGPRFAQAIVEAHEIKWDQAAANQARGDLIQRYHLDESWKSAQTDSIKIAEADALVKDALYARGIYHQLQARQNDSSQVDYDTAISQYELFLKSFAQDSMAYRVNYYLGESLLAKEDYRAAAVKFNKFSTEYPDNDLSEAALYNLVICYDRLNQGPSGTDTVIVVSNNFPGYPGPEAPVRFAVGDSVTKDLIEASNAYVERFPDSEKTLSVLMKEAEILDALGHHSLSRALYGRIMYDFPEGEHYATALAMTAQSFFEEENFVEAERWYEMLSGTAADSQRFAGRAKVMMATSFFKAAEKTKMAGHLRVAAVKFEEVAMKYPTAEVTEVALQEASALYQEAGDTVNAARLYENFVELNPESAFYESGVLHAARLREKMQHWRKAAENYFLLRNSTGNNLSIALYSAGVCFSKSGDWVRTIEVLRRFEQITEDLDRKLEANFKIGQAWFNQNKPKQAAGAFRKTITIYRDTPGREQLNAFYPAQAQFMLAEINLMDFAKIDLSPPFKTNLSRKTKSLSTVLQAYADAAKYRIGEWTTASSYKIGTVFEDFANAILTSPLPRNLSAEEIKTYELQLRSLATPFQKKALEAHQANVRQAEKNNIINSWTAQSRSKVIMLTELVGANGNGAGRGTGSGGSNGQNP